MAGLYCFFFGGKQDATYISDLCVYMLAKILQ